MRGPRCASLARQTEPMPSPSRSDAGSLRFDGRCQRDPVTNHNSARVKTVSPSVERRWLEPSSRRGEPDGAYRLRL
jgi:hypothetical protein